MTQATSQASETAQLPTIIIDPSLYEADAPLPKQVVRSGLRRLARVTLLTGAVGGATVGVAHLLVGDSLSQDLGVAALTKATLRADNDAALHAPPRADDRASLTRPAKPAAELAPPAEPASIAIREEARALEAVPRAALALVDPASAAPLATPPSRAQPGEPPSAQLEPEPSQALARVKRAPAAMPRATASAPRVDLEASIRGARRLQALNQLDEAEAAYQAVLAESAGQSAALVGLARIKLARGDLDAALAFAQRAVHAAPEQANVHLTLGDVLRARGDQPGAQAEYALAAPR